MLDASLFAEFVGFTDYEVQHLCKKYGCSYDECKSWYDGYHLGGYEIYNSQAVYNAMLTKKFKSYWSKTSSYTVVADKIRMNFSGTKDAVIAMLGGGRVRGNTEKYENPMTDFSSRNDIFTYLIHLAILPMMRKNKNSIFPIVRF